MSTTEASIHFIKYGQYEHRFWKLELSLKVEPNLETNIIDYNLEYIDTILYINYNNNEYITYYNNKTKKIINIFKSVSKKLLNIEEYCIDYLIFDSNLTNINDDLYKNDFLNLYNFFSSSKHNNLYVFNELDYCYFKAFYESSEINKNCIINFFKKSIYIITFTEIFENNNFQTVGNTSYNKEYSIYFFKYSYKTFLCDMLNIELIYNNITNHNVIYFPPLIYKKKKLIITDENNKDIDLLFYGSMETNIFYFRENLINIVKNYAKMKGLNFEIYNRELYDEEKKNDIFKRTKIVIHVGSLPDLRTIPWAKISELMVKGVFFIINNTDEINNMGLDIPRYFYVKEYIDSPTIIKELEYYLSNPQEREIYIKKNYEYILKYKIENIFSYIINYKENIDSIFNNNFNFTRSLCNIKNVNIFNYKYNNFHYNLSLQYKKFAEENGIPVYHPKIFDGLFNNYNKNKEDFLDFLLNYIPDNNSIYIFNTEDLMFFYYYYDLTNMELIYKFIKTAKYILFQYEVIIDNNLSQIGFKNSFITSKYSVDFTNYERDIFLKKFYINSQKVYICSYKNKEYLKINNIRNTVYYPPYINSTFKKNNKLKNIDCLFYGNTDKESEYRNIIIDKIKLELDVLDLKFISTNLCDEELNDALNSTKIVLYIPSHEKLHIMPWAKISHLMKNKIFFIIEENEELYNKNLENTIIYYKQGDINDLKNKIIYFINNEDKIQDIVEECYNYFNRNFNINILLKDLFI